MKIFIVVDILILIFGLNFYTLGLKDGLAQMQNMYNIL